MNQEHLLSKSTFLRGLKCPKALFLNRYRRELRDPISPDQEALFATGREVGQLARELFPGGVLTKQPDSFDFQHALKTTKALISEGAEVIYEAAFQHEQVLVLVDILVREGNAWRAYEVKSSTAVKENHIPDAAIQYFILSRQGIELADISIVHLDPNYVRQGELNLERLFSIVSVMEEVRGWQDQIPGLLVQFKQVLNAGAIPEIAIGPHCFEPYDCDFLGYCWRAVPDYSVFNLSRLSKKKAFALYREGIVHTVDVPEDFPLGDRARLQIASDRSGHTQVDQGPIRAFIRSLNYPIYFLDFETLNPAVPPYDGTRAYGQIPFQYSLHKKHADGSMLWHAGYLAEAGTDPRRPLIESLLAELGESGDIVVYSSFEAGRIEDLAEQFPEFSQALHALLDRLVDLMQIFKDGAYYAPEMRGSYSIKAVLPVLDPDLNYDELEIKDGGAAMRAFSALTDEQDPRRIETIRKALWDYCKLDSLAMVRILEELEKI